MTTEVKLAPTLLRDIRDGRVVLFLGAGASLSATDKSGKLHPPKGYELADILATEFLGAPGKYNDLGLVGDLLSGSVSLFRYQIYIANYFKNFITTDAHIKATRFPWKALLTVNYDDLVEQAYQKSGPSCAKDIVVFRSNSDRESDLITDPSRQIPYIKLHGCIDRPNDQNIPFILSRTTYAKYLSNRQNLFDRMKDLGENYSIVFIGTSMADPNIREIVEMIKSVPSPQHHYIIDPSIDDHIATFWSGNGFTPYALRFDQFISLVEANLTAIEKALLPIVQINHPIERHLKITDRLDPLLEAYLEYDFEYVSASPELPIRGSAKRFYSGDTQSWYPIVNNLDFKRSIESDCIDDLLNESENERIGLFLVKGAAGDGKSTFLRRIAWKMANNHNQICLFQYDGGEIDIERLVELGRLADSRLFVFIDDCSKSDRDISRLIQAARQNRDVMMTIVTAETHSLWNTDCENLHPFVTGGNEIRSLSRSEITDLIRLLEAHDCLGSLRGKDISSQIAEFEGRLKKQLLVILMEATRGKNFEEIVIDEYKSIANEDAKRLYLAICTLYRFGVKVRAGLISRAFNISMSHFDQDLFEPLERIVMTTIQKRGDVLYYSRHPSIANIVFHRILRTSTLKRRYIESFLKNLNTSYETDLEAFNKLIGAYNLIDIFGEDDGSVGEIHKIAIEKSPDNPFVHLQMGIYEMKRHNKRLDMAELHIANALDIDPNNRYAKHSLAEFYRIKSQQESSFDSREILRGESEDVAEGLMSERVNRRVALGTKIKLSLSRLSDMLSGKAGKQSEYEIGREIQLSENLIRRGLIDFPNDGRFLLLQSDLYYALGKDESMMRSIESAYKKHDTDMGIIMRYAKTLKHIGQAEKSLAILIDSAAKINDPRDIYFAIFEILRETKADYDKIISALRQSFIKGDSNYDRQYTYAKYCYMSRNNENILESLAIFDELKSRRSTERFKGVDAWYADDGSQPIFSGSIAKMIGEYGFIKQIDVDYDIYFKRSELKEAGRYVSRGKAVQYSIGFNYMGAQAINVRYL